MAKAGRKRKTGKREPNGRIQRTGEREADVVSIVQYARMRQFGCSKHQATDSRMGHAIGRLLLQGKIDQDQYDAAQTYHYAMNRYGVAMSIPKPNAKVASYSETIKAHDNSEPDVEWVEAAQSMIDEMHTAMIGSLGQRDAIRANWLLFNTVVCEDGTIPAGDVDLICRALKAIAYVRRNA